jgi:hypothetical protein
VTDVNDDITILDGQSAEFVNDDIEFDEQLAVSFPWPAAVETPAGSDDFIVERAENGLLGVVWNSHVVFDRIKAS